MVMLLMTLVSSNPQTTIIFAFFVAFHIFVVGECRDLKFLHRLTVASPNPVRTNRSWRGGDYVVTLFEFRTSRPYLRNGLSYSCQI